MQRTFSNHILQRIEHNSSAKLNLNTEFTKVTSNKYMTQTTINTEAIVSKAVNLFKQGYNCSQSIAMAFSEIYGIPEPLMSRFSASFGGGIGRMRETCGAACGMFMLAGLEVEDINDSPNPTISFDSTKCKNSEQRFEHLKTSNPYPSQELKKKDYEVVQLLANKFREETGSICCKELLGLNKQRADGTIPEIKIVATPEARTDEYYKKRPCIRMVETAVRIYCDYLNNKYNSEKH